MSERKPSCHGRAIRLSGVTSLFIAIAVPAVAGETRGYVVSWFDPALAVQAQEADCPKGMNEDNPVANVTRILRAAGVSSSEIAKATSKLPDSAETALSTRGRIDGKPVNPYLNPTSVPDPHMKLGEGKYAFGFNLDGNESTGGFTDPETGERGVDNQLFRAYACTASIRANPGARSTFGSTVWVYAQAYMPAWLIEVGGIRDLQDSPDVEVRISQATSPVSMDAKGNVSADLTFEEDPNPLTTTRVRGTIKNGVLTTGFMPHLNLNGERWLWNQMRWTHARIRLKWKQDGSVTGMIAGYHNWAAFLPGLISEGGWALEAMDGMDLPGLYYALRKLADADPNPKSGLNTSISTAFSIEAVPAFIVRKPPTPAAQSAQKQSVRSRSEGIPANPPGITIKAVRAGSGHNSPVASTSRERTVFATEAGHVLYTADADAEGISACTGACAATWTPAVATAEAAPVGHWSLIRRENGERQWAFRGKALYAYAPDLTLPKDSKAAVAGDAFNHAGEGKGQDVDGHHVLEIRPEQWMELPSEIQIQEVRAAPGYVLTDTRGLPLYSYEGKRDADAQWTPFEAAQASMPVGDFTIVRGAGGTRQWVYKGKPLYRFREDLDYGDANGKSADPDFRLNYALRFFMPDGVTVLNNRAYGGLLALADGTPLYARDTNFGGNAPRGDRGKPEIGEKIGASACDSQCEREWKPLIAPNDARPEGYWTIYKRADSRNQWAYCGYALYSPVTPAATDHLYDVRTDFEGLPGGGARASSLTHWRLSPP